MNYMIALGSNRPKGHLLPYDILSHAIWLLGGRGVTVTAQSRFFRTATYPHGAGPDWMRVAVQAHADAAPPDVAEVLRQVETALNGEGGPVLVAELLACGDKVLPSLFDFRRRLQNPLALADDLVLPHPELHECPARLTLMMDIAPDWPHPVFRRTVREMMAALPAGAFDGIATSDVEHDRRDVAE